jgi:hypothetical protein
LSSEVYCVREDRRETGETLEKQRGNDGETVGKHQGNGEDEDRKVQEVELN